MWVWGSINVRAVKCACHTDLCTKGPDVGDQDCLRWWWSLIKRGEVPALLVHHHWTFSCRENTDSNYCWEMWSEDILKHPHTATNSHRSLSLLCFINHKRWFYILILWYYLSKCNLSKAGSQFNHMTTFPDMIYVGRFAYTCGTFCTFCAGVHSS